jgi:hypothetical protein
MGGWRTPAECDDYALSMWLAERLQQVDVVASFNIQSVRRGNMPVPGG